MQDVVTIAGGAADSEAVSAVLNRIHTLLRRQSVRAATITVRNLPSQELMGRRIDRPAIDAAHSMLARAQGIVIATPLLRGSYSGLLKTFLDVLPFDAFVGKHVLPIVTGRDLRSSALDNALKPVLCAMGAASVLQSLALPEDQIFYEHGGTARLDTPLDERLETAVSALLRPHHSLNSRPNRFSEPPSSFGLTEDTIAVQEFEYGVHTL